MIGFGENTGSGFPRIIAAIAPVRFHEIDRLIRINLNEISVNCTCIQKKIGNFACRINTENKKGNEKRIEKRYPLRSGRLGTQEWRATRAAHLSEHYVQI
jgi:hypothetical protein